MNVLIIDGQGGRIGRQLVETILARFPETEITAVGTNSIATAAMIKGGATQAATGENAVLSAAKRADIIVGPIGIVIADALVGEVSPAMAVAVGQSRAKKILIPVNRCDNLVAGASGVTLSAALEDALTLLSGLLRA